MSVDLTPSLCYDSDSSWLEALRSRTSPCSLWWPAVWRTAWRLSSWLPVKLSRSDILLRGHFVNCRLAPVSLTVLTGQGLTARPTTPMRGPAVSVITNVVFLDWTTGWHWAQRTRSGRCWESEAWAKGWTSHCGGSLCQVWIHHKRLLWPLVISVIIN